MSERSKLLEQIIAISRGAGDIIMQVYESDDFDVQNKDDGDFVSPLTKADRLANQYIVAELGKISELPIVSEENDLREVEGDFWLVDPLDGTKEFVKRNGEFTVNIALMHDNRPSLGVVYAPVLDVYYCGDAKTQSAFKIVNGEKKGISADQKDGLPRVVVSRSHKDERTVQLLEAIGEHEEVEMGSSLKLCLVAEGVASLYPRLGLTSLWDTAAADAVVTAAGGKVTQLDGKALVYEPEKEILNPFFVVSGKRAIDWQKHLT